MTVEYDAVVDHNILARNTAVTARLVLTALDADAIIAYIETRTGHDDILARFDVDTVAVLRVIGATNRNILDDQIGTHCRMNIPARRVLERDPLQKHIFAMVDGDHHRTQEITHRFEILPGLGPRRDILVGTARRAEFETFRRIPDPTVIGNEATALDQIVPFTSCQLILLHGTPSGTVSVDDTLSCHGYVFRTDGRQRRLATPRIQPLESDLRQRIERLIGAEKKSRHSVRDAIRYCLSARSGP